MSFSLVGDIVEPSEEETAALADNSDHSKTAEQLAVHVPSGSSDLVLDVQSDDPRFDQPGSEVNIEIPEFSSNTSPAGIINTSPGRSSRGSDEADNSPDPSMQPANDAIVVAPDVPEPKDGSSGSNIGEKTGKGAKKKKTPAAKKNEPKKATFIKNTDRRTQHAKRSGEQLVKKCKDYCTKTGARVFFQSHYTGPKISHTFREGEYWTLTEDEGTQRASFTPEVVEQAVSKAMQASIAPLVRELRSKPKSPVATTSKTFLSPRKHPQASEKAELCNICHKKEVTKDFIVYESQWIGCTGDGKPCSKWVHADCLGFPGATEKEIKKMPEYFCQDHVSFGRSIKKVVNSYEADEDAAPTDEPPKKKGKKGAGRR